MQVNTDSKGNQRGNKNKDIHFYLSQILMMKNPCFFNAELKFPSQPISFSFSLVSCTHYYDIHKSKHCFYSYSV